MNYKQVKAYTNDAWEAFTLSLESNGFTSEQSERLMDLIDSKDSFNDVFNCVMEVADLECEE